LDNKGEEKRTCPQGGFQADAGRHLQWLDVAGRLFQDGVTLRQEAASSSIMEDVKAPAITSGAFLNAWPPVHNGAVK